MDFAERLIQYRKALGWTQAAAAKNIAIQQSYLSKLESGQFFPSEEVINKICAAYKITPDVLVPKAERDNKNLYCILVGIIGLTLMLAGYLALLYPQTYYTYKAKPIINQSELRQINYHVTDQYKGENYIQSGEHTDYEYSLVAERDISRVENRWLLAIGFLLVLLPGSVLAHKFVSKRSDT